MKKALLVFIASLSILHSYGQCAVEVSESGSYVFSEAKSMKYPMRWALVKDVNDFATFNIEELQGKGITKDYPNLDGMAIDLDGKIQKLKYADMAKDYAGFIEMNKAYRICEVIWADQKTSWRAVRINCIGEIAVYGAVIITNARKNDSGGYNYDYCALSDQTIYLSHKIDGKVYVGTSENFSILLGEISPEVKDAYLGELSNIPSLKPKDDVHKNKKAFEIFTKYLEIINNKEY